ncbi:MAG TPA: hypothetical protein VIH99_07550 [Bdellovibrionota bacterium]
MKYCTPSTRAPAIAAYHEGFESGRSRREKEKAEVGEGPHTDARERKPATLPWVCEVEASSKVFTGVGNTRDQALGSAMENCGSHFQASYCAEAECKQNL